MNDNINENCRKVILNRIYNYLEDENCFNRYHINDKAKNAQGETVATINEIVLNKPDTKMIKDIVDILNMLKDTSPSYEEEEKGVIILNLSEDI